MRSPFQQMVELNEFGPINKKKYTFISEREKV
jgi:hypothetical protein